MHPFLPYLHSQFLCHVLKSYFFIKITLKLSYYCKKMQNFRVLGAPFPDPKPPAAGVYALRIPKQSPIANFWLRACQDDKDDNEYWVDFLAVL